MPEPSSDSARPAPNNELSTLAAERLRREKAELALAERSRELMADLHMAAQFQRAILPELPKLPWLDLAVRYQPARLVSGDIYDLALNREGEIGMLVGDATGHGITGAFMTMMVHSAMDGIRGDLNTAETLCRLNQQLSERSTNRSVSAVFSRISPTGLLRVSHAGHPALLILRASGESVQLCEGGCALGMFAEEMVPYKEECLQLRNGDLIIAYTDGLNERANISGLRFGTLRLIEHLGAHREQALDKLLDTLLDRIELFANARTPDDDATILAARYRAVS